MVCGNFSIDLNKIDAILITHEHTDHTKCLPMLTSKYNIPIYITKKTYDALPFKEKINSNNIIFFNISDEFIINDLKIFSFNIPHDAAEPCGFNIYNKNKKISIVTDLGYIDDNLLNNLKESSSVILESNYDPNILKYSKYPYLLKKRISSNLGHLSNEEAGRAISYLTNYGLKNAMLIHLSKENNFPELAYQTVFEELKSQNNITLNVAPRNTPSKLYKVM